MPPTTTPADPSAVERADAAYGAAAAQWTRCFAAYQAGEVGYPVVEAAHAAADAAWNALCRAERHAARAYLATRRAA